MALSMKIEKSFGKFRMNMELEAKNEALALLGASGSGKSMALKCIAGIVKPDRGRIVLDGITLFDSKKHINLPPQKRKVGLLFQNYALFPNMTVEQNIKTGLRAAGKCPDSKQTVRGMMEMLYLNGLEKHYPNQLSGGQQQRVALARILIGQPKILMLDEPFSALDSYLRWQLEQEVSTIISEFSGTTLFVSHNRDEVYRICDRIAVVNHGSIDAVADKWGLFENPQTYSGALLTGCKNISAAKRISGTEAYAADWDMEFTCREVPEDLHFVGLRAHFLTQAHTMNEPHVFRCKVEREIEDTFTKILMLRHKSAPSLIRWEFEKHKQMRIENREVFVKIEPENLLLLR